MNRSHQILIKKESTHQDAKVCELNHGPIQHVSLENYSTTGPLKAFFARPFLASKTPLKVLELGCGSGGTAIRLAKVGHKVVSIDISAKSIAYARKGAIDAGVQEQITFHLCDATKIGKAFKNEEFDAVCGIGVLHHLDPLRSVLTQIKDLRPEIVVFIEAMGTNPFYGLIRKFMVGKSHTNDEHPLKKDDLDLIRALFPGVRMLFGGMLTPHYRLRVWPVDRFDCFASNLGPLWRLAKTVAIVWERDAALI